MNGNTRQKLPPNLERRRAICADLLNVRQREPDFSHSVKTDFPGHGHEPPQYHRLSLATFIRCGDSRRHCTFDGFNYRSIVAEVSLFARLFGQWLPYGDKSMA